MGVVTNPITALGKEGIGTQKPDNKDLFTYRFLLREGNMK